MGKLSKKVCFSQAGESEQGFPASPAGLSDDGISEPGEDPGHLPDPFCIVSHFHLPDVIVPDLPEGSILAGKVGPDHHPPRSPPISVKDKETPAAELLADLRPGRVHSAVAFPPIGVASEERAGLGPLLKRAPVFKQVAHQGRDPGPGLLPGIHIPYQVFIVSKVSLDLMDIAHLGAALPALLTVERHDP